MELISVDQKNQPPLDDFGVCLQHESWTRQQLEEYQARALRTCREYAYAHSPFYQRFHQGLMDHPLQELPVLTKAMAMEHFDELVTDRAIRLHDVQQHFARPDAPRLYLDRYQVTPTSGSTGQPGLFLYDGLEKAIDDNSFIRCLYWAGVSPDSRAALVTTTAPAQLSSQPTIAVEGQRVTRLQMSANDPLETLVQRLNDWQPDSFFGYASITAALANEQRQGRLHISPNSLGCGADTLTSEMRRLIEETWQRKIFNVYGTTEGGALGTECSYHQGMHLFEDFSIMEIVDQDNRPVPPGEQGSKVLITVLYRRTQPLIRYELSDLVRTSTIESCICGRPFALIEAIQGRMAEVIYLPSPTGSEEGIYPYLFTSVFNTQPVSGWQVVQEHNGLHVFLTGASEDLQDEHLLTELRQALTKRGVIVPAIEIHRVTTINRNTSGKAPMVISRVPRQTS